MRYVDVEKAEATWLDLVARVEAGEAFVLTRKGAPVACLTPANARIPGAMMGQISIGPEFFEPLLDSELDGWE